MPSTYDLVARRFDEPDITLLSRSVYGPDFVRKALNVPDCSRATYAVRNAYYLRGTGGLFIPALVGVVEHIEANLSVPRPVLSIHLGMPPVVAGHPIDVICWDQLETLRRVIEADNRVASSRMWDPVNYRDVLCLLDAIEPWSVGPTSDTEGGLENNRFYVNVGADCNIARSTPSKLFERSAETNSSSASSVTLDESAGSINSWVRGLAPGDFVAVKCALTCDHVVGDFIGGDMRRVVRRYCLVASELSIVV
ncbi:hypothetical protein B0H11DRAFT_2214750 [Mycena galericulata]|nr:hypothetical protein B0H11DRAFT_2214750 [Mycena galericulata]